MKDGPLKVLLVEDNPGDARLVREALAEVRGARFALTHVDCLAPALKQLAAGDMDVILLDLSLPDASGLETLSKTHAAAPGVPIVVLTGLDDEEVALKAVHEGAQDYLVKGHMEGRLLTRSLGYAIERQRLLTELQALRQREKEEAEKALAEQKALTGWNESAVTASVAGVGPLRERSAEVFAELEKEYGSLLDRYLEALGSGEPPPRRQINALADRLGDQGAGPRDLVDLHIRVVRAKCEDVAPQRAKAYTQNGRLLALEVMGNIVDYYRTKRPAFV